MTVREQEEVELKAGVDAATLAQLRRLPRLREGTIGRPRSQLLLSVYYDAADWRLQKAGMFLRMRRVGRRWEQTVKAARQAQRGLQRVTEINDPAADPQPDLRLVSSPSLRESLERTLDGAALRPVFRSEVRRVSRLLRHADGCIEVALDRGCVVAGDRRSDFCEVEFECIDGGAAAVFDWAARVLAPFPARLQQPSKAARGFLLARGASPPPPAPLHTSIADVPRVATGSEAIAALFDLYAPAVSENLYCVMTGSDSEGPHQLRVSLRRLRALLLFCEQALGWKAGGRLRRQARDLGRLVAALRDADVLVEDIAMPALGADDDASVLLDPLDARRERTRAATRRALCEAGATAFALRLLEIAELHSWQPRQKKRRRRLDAPLLRLLEPVLDRAWKKVRRRGRRLERLSAAKRHRLRKDLKQLRYLAEIATLAADAPDSRRFFRRLERLQDDLGLLNDLVTLEQRHIPADDPAARDCVAGILERLQTSPALDAQTVLARAARRWRKLHKAGPFWRAAR